MNRALFHIQLRTLQWFIVDTKKKVIGVENVPTRFFLGDVPTRLESKIRPMLFVSKYSLRSLI
jgi:hypothetical protein